MNKKDLRIFIAEDEFIIALYMETFLIEAGYEIVGKASRGEDVLAKVPLVKPNLILMDIGLAGRINGIEAALKLADDPSLAIIFITGNSDILSRDPRIQEINPLASWIKPMTEDRVLTQLQIHFPD